MSDAKFKSVRGLLYECVSCGHKSKDYSKFCMNCGAAQPPPPEKPATTTSPSVPMPFPNLDFKKPKANTPTAFSKGTGEQISVSSLQEDIHTKEELKYNPELERMAKKWIEEVLGEKLPTGRFVDVLKSGVVLCKLINKIKPGVITKINTNNVAYSQMENIGNFLKACEKLGMRDTDLFNTPDLFEERNVNLVTSSIHVLAKHASKLADYKGPQMEAEDKSKTRNLFSEALMQSDPKMFESDDKPLDSKQQDYVNWINAQLKEPDLLIKNLTSDLRSGVRLLRLLEIVSKQSCIGKYNPDPINLWQCMQNISLMLRFLTSQYTFESCTARDIVTGNVNAVMGLLDFIREKFDLEYHYEKLMNAPIDPNVDYSDLMQLEMEAEEEGESVTPVRRTASKDPPPPEITKKHEEPKITPSTSKEEDAIKKEEKKGIKGWIGSLKKKKSPVVEAEEKSVVTPSTSQETKNVTVTPTKSVEEPKPEPPKPAEELKPSTSTDSGFSKAVMDDSKKRRSIQLGKVRKLPSAQELHKLKAQLGVRKRVVEELLNTEKSYYNNLVITEQFVNLCKSKKVLTDEDLFSVCGNISELRELHKNFLGILQERIGSWTDSSVIGDVFDKFKFFEIYKKYIHNYNVSFAATLYLTKKNPEFNKLIEKFEDDQASASGLNLDSFLIMPVQRLPRYILLLRDCHKYTYRGSADMRHLPKAIDYLDKNLSEINKGISKGDIENAHQILDVEKSIDGEFEPLVKPKRKYVREGAVKVKGRSGEPKSKFLEHWTKKDKRCYWFLFSDILVWVKPKKETESGKVFEYIATVPISEIVEVKETPAVACENGFSVVIQKETWTVKTEGEKERQLWLLELMKWKIQSQKTNM